MLNILKNPKVIILLIVMVIFGASGAYAMVVMGISPGDIKTFVNIVIERISDYPLLVYLSILIVGGLPLPLSPFLLLAGVLFTSRYGVVAALALCHSAMILNMVWTYFLSAYPMRKVFEKIVALFSNRFPEIPEEHKSKVAIIIRLTPGIPFFLQNYFLGVSRVPFGKYIVISVGIQLMYTTAFVVGGGAIFEGKAGLGIAAIFFFIIIGIVVQWLRKRNPETQTEQGVS